MKLFVFLKTLKAPMESSVFLWAPQCPYRVINGPLDSLVVPLIPHVYNGFLNAPICTLMILWNLQSSNGLHNAPLVSWLFPWIPHCFGDSLNAPMASQCHHGFVSVPMDS